MPSEAEKAAAVQAYSDYISRALKGGAGRWHVSDAVIAALEAAERVRRIDEVVRHIAADGSGSIDTDSAEAAARPERPGGAATREAAPQEAASREVASREVATEQTPAAGPAGEAAGTLAASGG